MVLLWCPPRDGSSTFRMESLGDRPGVVGIEFEIARQAGIRLESPSPAGRSPQGCSANSDHTHGVLVMADIRPGQQAVRSQHPPGKDDATLVGFSGHEGVSQLFQFAWVAV